MDGGYICEVRLNSSPEPGSYLNDLPAVRFLKKHAICFQSPVAFLIGENGSGKSTLLEGIAAAWGFNAEGGSKNFRFSTHDTHSALHRHLTLVRRGYAKDGFFLRAESLCNVATNIDEIEVSEYYGGKSLHEQSHGESFLTLIRNRFYGNGLYILDEPEAALSPMNILTLMAEINRLIRQNSQFIIATHSPMLMAFPGAQILELSQDGIRQVEFRETEHYRVTKGFLDDPEHILRLLFAD